MSLGERIKQLRVKKNMSQEALAEAAGITKASVSNYERNKRQPQYPAVQAIARALGVPVFELFDGVDGKDNVESLLEERRVDNIRARRMKRISETFERLSDEGQLELIKRAEELVWVPQYRVSVPEALLRHINDQYGAGYELAAVKEEVLPDTSKAKDCQISIRHIILKRESTTGIFCWHLMYYQLNEMLDNSIVEEIVSQYDYSENRVDKYSFVLDNKNIFDQFCNCLYTKRGYDDVDDFSSGNVNKPEIIFFLIDKETYEIKDVSSMEGDGAI